MQQVSLMEPGPDRFDGQIVPDPEGVGTATYEFETIASGLQGVWARENRLRGHAGSLNMSVIGQVGPSPADPGSDGGHIEIYQTTDWYNNQSSLNGAQADVDRDGILRVVVSRKDPGVPNWVDTAGFSRGLVQGRWTNCDSHPVPTVKKVPLADIRDYLPADTPVIQQAQREKIVRERRAAYQQRRHW